MLGYIPTTDFVMLRNSLSPDFSEVVANYFSFSGILVWDTAALLVEMLRALIHYWSQ